MFIKFIRKHCKEGDLEELFWEGGKHIVGREQLNCNDKRISRRHFSLEFQDQKVVFTALHTNPCFYFSSSSPSSMQIIHQNECRILNDGDEVSFLPDSFRFIVSMKEDAIKTNMESVRTQMDEMTDSIQRDMECENTLVSETRDANTTDDDVIPMAPEAPPMVDLCDDEAVDFNDGEVANHESNDEHTENVPSPSIIDTHEEASPAKRKCEEERELVEEGSAGARGAVDEEVSQQSSKRARLETDSPKEEKHSIQNDQGIDVVGSESSMECQAGPSGSVKQEVKEESSGGEVKREEGQNSKAGPARDKCQYGDKCYRRNPQHRADMSHPGDHDWETRTPCPYGSSCYRQNAQHRSLYTHPGPPAPRPQPAAPGEPREVRVERNGNIFHITANAVNFYDDHFEVEDFQGDSVDYDYEF